MSGYIDSIPRTPGQYRTPEIHYSDWTFSFWAKTRRKTEPSRRDRISKDSDTTRLGLAGRAAAPRQTPLFHHPNDRFSELPNKAVPDGWRLG